MTMRPLPIAFLLAALLAAALVSSQLPVRAAARITPNSPWQEGVNAAVWQDDGPSTASSVADAARLSSGSGVSAIWLLQAGQWAYYLPEFPSASSLQQVPAVASVFVVLAGGAAVTDQQRAVDVLTREVIKPETLGPNARLVAFKLDAPLPAGTRIAPYLSSPLPSTGVTGPCSVGERTLDRPTWFFWIDDYPDAMFGHPTRYVFIHELAGHTVTAQDWPPCIDGEPVARWTDDNQRGDARNIAYTNISLSASSTLYGGAVFETLLQTSGSTDRKPAVIVIDGSRPNETARRAFEAERKRAAEFAEKGLMPFIERTVETAVRPGLPAVEDAIKDARARGADTVLLAINGHGWKASDGQSFVMIHGHAVRADALRDLLNGYPDVKFNTAVQSCRSGGSNGFEEVLKQSPNVESVQTCTGAGDGLCMGRPGLLGGLVPGEWGWMKNLLEGLDPNRLRTDPAGALNAAGAAARVAAPPVVTGGTLEPPRPQPTAQPTTQPTPTETPSDTRQRFSGRFEGAGEFNDKGCIWRKAFSGTIEALITFEGDRVLGGAGISSSFTADYISGPQGCSGPHEAFSRSDRAIISGSGSRITFEFDQPYTHATFTGSLIGNAIVGDIVIVATEPGLTGSLTIRGVTLNRGP